MPPTIPARMRLFGVSANGVRKRLLTYYANAGLAREPGSVQICLPAGSSLLKFHTLHPGAGRNGATRAVAALRCPTRVVAVVARSCLDHDGGSSP